MLFFAADSETNVKDKNKRKINGVVFFIASKIHEFTIGHKKRGQLPPLSKPNSTTF
jgi:hypothetical protein